MVLLDTDAVSFLIRGDSRADAFLRHLEGRRPALSFMSVAELFQWAELRHWGERRKGALETLLQARYAILGVELGLTKEWARIRSEGKAQGRPISVQDGWVAATARYWDLPLLTHNRNDFEAVAGITLLGDDG